MLNTTQLILLISLLIIFSSYIITNFLDKSYSFGKLSAFLLFYYFLIILFAWIFTSKIKITNGKMIGSIAGFITSLILWFMYGKQAKK